MLHCNINKQCLDRRSIMTKSPTEAVLNKMLPVMLVAGALGSFIAALSFVL